MIFRGALRPWKPNPHSRAGGLSAGKDAHERRLKVQAAAVSSMVFRAHRRVHVRRRLEHHRADAARFRGRTPLDDRGGSRRYDEHRPFAPRRDDRQRQLHVRLSHGRRGGRRRGGVRAERCAVRRADDPHQHLRAVLLQPLRRQGAQRHPRGRTAHYRLRRAAPAQEQPEGCRRLADYARHVPDRHVHRLLARADRRLRRAGRTDRHGGAAAWCSWSSFMCLRSSA